VGRGGFKTPGKGSCVTGSGYFRIIEIDDLTLSAQHCTATENLLSFPYLMTVTHLSECSKEKLKPGTSFPRIQGTQNAPSLQQDFSCERSAAEVKPTWQSRNTVIARRQSRRGNPVRQTTGLLHFVRNDANASFVLLDCFTSFAMTAF
jgi:hypothetical protein